MAAKVDSRLLALPYELFLSVVYLLDPSSAQALTKTCRVLHEKKKDIINESLKGVYGKHPVITDLKQLKDLEHIKYYIESLDLSNIPSHRNFAFLSGYTRLQKVIIIPGTTNKAELFKQLEKLGAAASFK